MPHHVDPTLTILIPTFNRAKRLQKCLADCLEQNIVKKEIVVSDNASTDDTPTVVQSFAAKALIRSYRQDHNVGFMANIRYGIRQLVRSPYVVIMCDDDRLLDVNYFREACAMLDRHQEIGFVHANVEIEDEIKKTKKIPVRTLPSVYSGKEFFLQFGGPGHDYAYFMTVVVRSDLARAVNLYGDPNIPHGDSLAWLRCALQKDVGYIDRVVARYVLHGSNGITSIDVKTWLSDIRFYELAYADAVSSGKFSRQELVSWRNRMRRTYCGLVIRLLAQHDSPRECLEVLAELQRRHQAYRDPSLVLEVAKSALRKVKHFFSSEQR